jgi:uncharacterized protein
LSNEAYSSDPLSAIQANELERILLNDLGLKNPMNFPMLDGYICAVVSGPRHFAPSQWLPAVWDTNKLAQVPEFRSQMHMDQVVSLIMQHHNHVLAMIPHTVKPAIERTGHLKGSAFALPAWCMGYRVGMHLDIQTWQPIANVEPEWLDAIDPELSNDVSVVARDTQRIYAWWRFRETMVSPSSRMAPCPCGSGKRFKNCHGNSA